MERHNGTRRAAAIAMIMSLLSILSSSHCSLASAIAAPPLAARLATAKRQKQTGAPLAPSAAETQSAVLESPSEDIMSTISGEATTSKAAPSNPVVQLVTYVKDSMVNFKNGLGQMNLDHRRCNYIRSKQRAFATENGFSRPRGVKGIQTGGISYEGESDK
jgi:hypothetical protein